MTNGVYSTSAPNERVWRITQLAKFSFKHRSVVLITDVFQFFCIVCSMYEYVVVEYLQQYREHSTAQHSAISLHKAANQVRADQSTYTYLLRSHPLQRTCSAYLPNSQPFSARNCWRGNYLLGNPPKVLCFLWFFFFPVFFFFVISFFQPYEYSAVRFLFGTVGGPI